jgi:hypothetical protein
MTIRDIKTLKNRRQRVDLTGPEGNVLFLMALAEVWAGDLGLDAERIIADMKSSNYEHAVEVMEREFGEHVDFYR